NCPARALRQKRLEEVDVRRVDARPALPLEPLFARRVVAEPRESSQRERVRAEDPPREVVLHVPAHALDDGHDRDEEHHADHHAEQREEALQLLDADLLERETDRFDNGHDLIRIATRPPDRAWLRASRATSRTARR